MHFRWLAQCDLRRRFIDLLKPYVSDVAEASRVLRRTRSVISGSQVLQFLDPSNTPWKDTAKDLDLYTTEEGFPVLLAFYINYQSYSIHGSSHSSLQKPVVEYAEPVGDGNAPEYVGLDSGAFDGLNPEGISSVTQLRKGHERIDIIVSQDNFCSTLPIFNFHSTIVMNFLSPDAIFCAYPALTFKKTRFS